MNTAKGLAERNGVYAKLRPLFEYQAGDVSPPQAPKHTTAASNKTRPLIRPAPRAKKITSAHLSSIFMGLWLTNRTQSNAYLYPDG